MKTVAKRKSGTSFRKRTAKLKPKLYEAMFLVDSAEASADWDGIITAIKNILKKAKAEIVSIKKWDDRKLAYEINGHTRGTYILCYFRAEGRRLREIERNVQLSERIMRVLILRAEHKQAEDIEKDSVPQKDSKTGTQKDAASAPKAGRAEKHKQKDSQADEERETRDEN